MENERHDRVVVGRQIKRLRQEQELTVQDLAIKAKVSPGYLSEVERGIPAVSLDKLRQIAEGLGVAIDALLDELSPASSRNQNVVQIPAALSAAAERLNLSHRATLTLLQGQRSLMARRAKGEQHGWSADDWLKFYEQVKEYLPEC